jgi:hypothetical protein
MVVTLKIIGPRPYARAVPAKYPKIPPKAPTSVASYTSAKY